MEQRNLGKSGLQVSAIGLGCNNFGGRSDFAATKAVVHKALDLGITFFDEADTYGDPRGNSESYLGEILGDRRKDIVLATKFARPMDGSGRFEGASRHYIIAEVEASLRRLKTDWIDLYQQHQPELADFRSRRPCARSMISCVTARCAISGAQPCRPGRWSRRNGPRAIIICTVSSRARRSTAF